MSEHLNKIEEMNSGFESRMKSIHAGMIQTDGATRPKITFTVPTQFCHKQPKHSSMGKAVNHFKQQRTELNTPDIQFQKEINMIKKAIQEQDSKIKELETLISTLTSDVVNKMETKISSMEQTMEAFTIRMKSLEERDNSEKITLDDLASKVDNTDVRLATLLSEREQEGHKFKELEGRVLEAETNRINDWNVYQQKLKDVDTIKELEGRVLEAETNRRNDWNFYQHKLKDVENLYKQVCVMVAGQVKPLRRLQDTLNKNIVMAEKRKLLISQVESVNDTVTDLVSRMSNLESRERNTTVGFTAYLPLVTKMATSSVMKEFTDIICNEGNCYNPATGLFKAPKDGLYYASVTLRQRKEGHVDVNLIVMRRESGETRVVGKSGTHSDKKASTVVGVVKLKAGDALFVRAVTVVPEVSLSQYSSFTCYLIG